MSDLRTETTDGVLRLVLDRPDRYNALSGEMTLELIRELRGAVTRDDVRVVLLTGTGDAFSAGADIGDAETRASLGSDAVDAANELVRTIVNLDKPVVCGLNGIAAGVGMSVAVACDLVVAKESAALTLVFSRVGLMPDGGASLTVAAAVGRTRAMRLALTSDVLTAQEAYDAGLVSHVVPDAEYDETLGTLLRRLAGGPPLSFAATKKAINAATLGNLPDAFGRERAGQTVLLRSEDAREGMTAFAEKRRPQFRGR